jgi:hypothetical protein
MGPVGWAGEGGKAGRGNTGLKNFILKELLFKGFFTGGCGKDYDRGPAAIPLDCMNTGSAIVLWRVKEQRRGRVVMGIEGRKKV